LKSSCKARAGAQAQILAVGVVLYRYRVSIVAAVIVIVIVVADPIVRSTGEDTHRCIDGNYATRITAEGKKEPSQGYSGGDNPLNYVKWEILS
jgi:hypothetical protein